MYSDHSLAKVYLVGAGPGDPSLLTLRAAELLRRADCVVYDYLVDDAILGFVSPEAELIDVGKRPSRPMPQEQINTLLVALAGRKKTIVRLKGGDPFVFGRGGEEAQALADSSIAFEVVPGISSAIAAPAYAGVPVTHRSLASAFVVMTGHTQANGVLSYNWKALVDLKATIVVLMGVAHRAEIAQALISAGADPVMAVVSVTWATRGDQKVVRTTLEELGATEIDSPSVLVIGGSASLDLSWRSLAPLSGLSIVLTRGDSQASPTEARFRELGARVIIAPTIEISEPSDGGHALRTSLGRLESFDWVVFTSVNAVEKFMAELIDVRTLGGLKIASIGNATADALKAHHIIPDLLPTRFVSEGLVQEFENGPGRVLIPQAKVARDVLRQGLIDKGWEVEVVEAYTNRVPSHPTPIALLQGADLVTFTSSSTLEGFLSLYGRESLPPAIGVIGPVTRGSAESHGLEVTFEAQVHDIDGLLDATVKWWGARGEIV